MFRAFSGALSLALAILVLKLFLPEVAEALIVLTVKVLHILNVSVDQASTNLPH